MSSSLTILEVDLAIADLDQIEICQLKNALGRAEDVIRHLEKLKDVDQMEIVQLQAHIDEPGKMIKALQEENSRLKGRNLEILSNTQEPRHTAQGFSSHHHSDITRTNLLVLDSQSASASTEEAVAISTEDLNMDDAVKDDYLSGSDSGFEDVGSENGLDST
ncbi:hypothetical protein BDP55DRAFT_722195 [Colletotrichum godetiae]|uniref:Uncharacterized protein n=1 Tax=Colletotrichum godetiae TaxID=1209918 RepID=A0AAJ0AZ04_9PEZI|nr:uncharacterized protein BDP55DRAFT_722195 [Colletotrichum godetiae]KAK1700909.1 hypothetical protein BDP55DRAFT_722195 [Colletotrichum godetiae]